jgi:DNA topoisomerase-1
MAARKAVRRRWVLDSYGIRREGSKESGFHYVSTDGRKVSDEKILTRIKRLRIPPAWRDVRIARGDTSPLQAVGVDKKGRTQYLYHPKFRQQREQEKFRRVVEFGESLPELRRRVRSDLKREELNRQRVLASMVRLIDQAFFRIGNDESARSESTFGLTTVRPEHVRVVDSAIHFDFIGKWRKAQKQSVKDSEIAALIKRLTQMRGGRLFKFQQGQSILEVKDRQVNDYIQSIIGECFTAKDFRTWAGTLLCSIALGMQGQAETRTERKRRVKKAIEATAQRLGNTPAVCRSSYICPRLLQEYMEGKPFEMARKQKKGNPVVRIGLSREEKALLKFLRETIADRRRHPRAA